MAKNTKSSLQHPDNCTRDFWRLKRGTVPFALGVLLTSVGSIWTTITRPWNSGVFYATAATGLWLTGLLLLGLGLLLSILNTHRMGKLDRFWLKLGRCHCLYPWTLPC